MFKRFSNTRVRAIVGVAALVLFAIGCTATSPQLPRSEIAFPIVRPFAIERAGSQADFEVELPLPTSDPQSRSIFVGFRAVHDPRPADSFSRAQPVIHYLEQQDIPVRLEVTRRVDGQWRPVTMSTMRFDSRGQSVGYAMHPDPVFRRHRAAHWDGAELLAAGHWRDEHVYIEHEIAAFHDPVPGRYRIRVTNLAQHPALAVMPFEIVVARRRRY